jgi:hypothetical protein
MTAPLPGEETLQDCHVGWQQRAQSLHPKLGAGSVQRVRSAVGAQLPPSL